MVTFGIRSPGRAYKARPGAYGIARNRGGRVMIVESPKGLLGLSGGGRRSGESDAACLARELREETGCGIAVGTLLAEATQVVDAWEEAFGYEKLCRFFQVEITAAGEPGEPGHLVHWMEPDHAMTRLHEEAQRWAVGQDRLRSRPRKRRNQGS